MNTSENKDFMSHSSIKESLPKISYGNYKMFYKKNNTYKIAIGPHWYLSLIGISTITIVSISPLFKLYKIISPFFLIIYIILFLSVFILYLLAILKNPGIVPRKFFVSEEEDLENRDCYDCDFCRRIRNGKEDIRHCWECDICIRGLDHHCIWMGKCIGKNNLRLFYGFIVCVPLFFCYMIFMTIFFKVGKK